MGLKPGAALITGAAMRVGRALALDLAAQGWSVAIHFNTSRDAAERVVAAALAAGAPRAQAVQADLLDPAQTATLVARACAALAAPLTLLVNNASVFEPDDLRSATAQSWDRHIDSNLRAPFFLMQAFAAQAPKAGRDADGQTEARACAINMIDQRVWRAQADFMSYGLAKSGLWALTRNAALALAPHVRVNGIGPGPTLRGVRQRAEHFAAERADCPLQRGAEPAEIALALRFILGASSLTGQMIAMDGGQHLG